MQKFRACVDHFGIFRKEGNVTDPFFRLGFVAAGGADHLVMKDGKPGPGAGALIFENAYIELSMKAIYADPIWPKGGLTYFQFGTMDAVATHDKLAAAGFQVGPVATMSRYADHGERKGEAGFTFFRLTEQLLNNADYGAVQHLNRELMYQPTRYVHKNGVEYVNALIIFEDDTQKAEELVTRTEKFMDCVGEPTPSGGVKQVHVMNRGEAKAAYGVEIPEETKNVVGVNLYTPDLQLVRDRLAGFRAHEVNGGIVVDLLEEMNVFLVFTQEKE